MTDWNQFNPVPRGALPADLRRFRLRTRGHNVSFEPRGPVHCCGNPETLQRIRNPVERLDVVPFTARLFVGLNVGDAPTYSIEDVVRLVRQIRTRQGAPPDASFLAQRGLFTGAGGRVIEEDSVQVVIFNFGQDEQLFEREMEDLAQELTERLRQQGDLRRAPEGGHPVPGPGGDAVTQPLNPFDAMSPQEIEETSKLIDNCKKAIGDLLVSRHEPVAVGMCALFEVVGSSIAKIAIANRSDPRDERDFAFTCIHNAMERYLATKAATKANERGRIVTPEQVQNIRTKLREHDVHAWVRKYYAMPEAQALLLDVLAEVKVTP
jgi:hypothetical protein